MRYSLRVCPVCQNDVFGIAMADGHPFYYCPRCDTHFERPELIKVDVDYKGKFYVFDENAGKQKNV